MQACEFYKFEDYEVNEDLTITTFNRAYVDLSEQELDKLPFSFYHIDGTINLSENNLVDMKGFPLSCGENVFCPDNQISNIEDCTKEIGGNLVLDNNRITSLIPIKDVIFSGYRSLLGVNNNLLISLEGCPKVYHLDCSNNQIDNLDHLPDGLMHLKISNNKLTNIDNLPYSLYSIELENNLITTISSNLRDMIINNKIRLYQLKGNPIHGLFLKLYMRFSFPTTESIVEVIDRIEEFEVIKDNNRLDLISLRSLLEFYDKDFNESLFLDLDGYTY